MFINFKTEKNKLKLYKPCECNAKNSMYCKIQCCRFFTCLLRKLYTQKEKQHSLYTA